MGCPAVIKACDGTTSFTFRFWEMHSTTAHRYTGSYSNASLLIIVHSAIEVINHTIMLYHIAFMGKHLVVRLCRPDQVFALPTLPVQKVATDGKSVKGIILT